jgi:hypothetical protein
LLAVREIVTHEETHVWQMSVGLFFSEDVITSDPDHEQLRGALIKVKYPKAYLKPENVLDESMAHLAAGRWKDLGYKTEAEGLAYLERVFDRVYTDFGADALRGLRLRTNELKGVRENVISRSGSGLSRGVGPSRGGGGEPRIDAGGEIERTRASLRGREREWRGWGDGFAGEVPRTEPGGGVARTRADIERPPFALHDQVGASSIKQTVPFIEDALAAGANVDHLSIRHGGSHWTVVSFENARGTYLVKGEDVYVTQRSVREAQAAIEADPVTLQGIGDLQLAGDIEIRVSEIRSAENRIESRSGVVEHSLSM